MNKQPQHPRRERQPGMMTGFPALLTPEQRARILTYAGPDILGDQGLTLSCQSSSISG